MWRINGGQRFGPERRQGCPRDGVSGEECGTPNPRWSTAWMDCVSIVQQLPQHSTYLRPPHSIAPSLHPPPSLTQHSFSSPPYPRTAQCSRCLKVFPRPLPQNA